MHPIEYEYDGRHFAEDVWQVFRHAMTTIAITSILFAGYLGYL